MNARLAHIFAAVAIATAGPFTAPVAATASASIPPCDKEYDIHQENGRVYASGYRNCGAAAPQPLAVEIQVYVANEDGTSQWVHWTHGYGTVSAACPRGVNDFRHSVTKQQIRCQV